MELTSQSFEEITFGAKKVGYDPTEVDEFLSAGKEYIAELEDRLRRVTERAARAEQQLDSGSSGLGAAEIGKVWERAAAAAEAAVDEARTEAQRILADARYHSDMQLGDARRQSESIVQQAHDDAARISAEAQSQLRIEVGQLEATREKLRNDVHILTNYSEQQLERVRNTLASAMEAVEAHANGEAPPAEVAEALGPPPAPQVQQPEQPQETFAASTYENEVSSDPWSSNGAGEEQYGSGEWGSDSTTDEQEWAAPAEGAYTGNYGAQGQDSYSDDEYAGTGGYSNESYSNNNDTYSEGYSNEGYGSSEHGNYANRDPYADDAEEESDPFLAELRRAVQDDGPLGPRDSATDDDDDVNSINRLYSPEDDTEDRSGFFRRKK